MKRFINLGDQINDDNKEFAFYCTVKSCFETFSGIQTWSSIKDFKRDYDGNDIERYLDLIPDDFYKKNWNNKYSAASLIFMVGDKVVKDISHVTYNESDSLESLNKKLNQAVFDEDYELAEILRVKILKFKKDKDG